MFLAKVIGQVVATQKDSKLTGSRLVILRPLQIEDGKEAKLVDGKNTIVAVDASGAGVGQVVLFCQGSSARQTSGMKELPIDAAVIGLVDHVEALSKELYKIIFVKRFQDKDAAAGQKSCVNLKRRIFRRSPNQNNRTFFYKW